MVTKLQRIAAAGATTGEAGGRDVDKTRREEDEPGKGLRASMGGRNFCKEHELTRDVLLSLLKAEGQVTEVELMEDSDGTRTARLAMSKSSNS